MDTVCPPGFTGLRRDGRLLRGPGTADMKGGLVVMVRALKTLESLGLLDSIPAVCIFNSDEEINSPTSADLFRRIGRHASFGLVFECAGLDHAAVTTRRGITVLRLFVRGRGGHAGLYRPPKASAVLEAAHKTVQLEALNRADGALAVNVGKAVGGVTQNAIADRAELLSAPAPPGFRIRVSDNA
jgi:glutamate carboxypeptidase